MATQVSTDRLGSGGNVIPRLESGDRLTQKEFHRRYEAMPRNIKAELVKGVVYMASPVGITHAVPHARMMAFLGLYSASTRGVELSDNVTYIAADDYEPQPDAVLRVDERFGGDSWVNDSGYLEGSPEMVVEIASSSVSYDLHDKLEMYEKKSVQEYIVWRVLDRQIDWFQLENGQYRKIAVDHDGIVESRVFPGLRLDLKAMVGDDSRVVMDVLQSGLASPEYVSFATSLENRRSPR